MSTIIAEQKAPTVYYVSKQHMQIRNWWHEDAIEHRKKSSM